MSTSTCRIDELIELGREAERIGAWEEAVERYEAALRLLPTEGSTARAAELLRWIGTVHRQRWELDLADDVYEASLAVAESGRHLDQVAAGINCVAAVEQLRGNLDAAEALYSRARLLAETSGDERLAAMVDQNLGILANIRGNLATALVSYRSALERYRRLDDEHAAIGALNNMGMAHVDLEEWEDAEACFSEAHRLAERVRDQTLVGTVELNRAELYLKRQRFEHARLSCDRAFAIFNRLNVKSGLAESYKFYGVLYRETAKAHLSEIHLGLAVRIAADCGDRLLEAESATEWALAHLAEGRGREAVRLLNRAHRLFGELRARRELLDIERRMDDLRRTYLEVVHTWGSEAIDSKDHYTMGHCRRVADYAVRLAEKVGFEGENLTWVRIGALLHDVGKTALPADLLSKQGALSLEEWSLMRHHTLLGDEIVADLEFPWDIRPMVRNHHEHWDGSGYPDGLDEDAIPLTARILTVADVFDALTTPRSYRPAFGRDEALRLMERESGRVLDPDLFSLFRNIAAESVIGEAESAAAVPLW